MDKITTIGLDLAKQVFHVVGLPRSDLPPRSSGRRGLDLPGFRWRFIRATTARLTADAQRRDRSPDGVKRNPGSFSLSLSVLSVFSVAQLH